MPVGDGNVEMEKYNKKEVKIKEF
jgi:SNF2 family DNA or RNA helicase